MFPDGVLFFSAVFFFPGWCWCLRALDGVFFPFGMVFVFLWVVPPLTEKHAFAHVPLAKRCFCFPGWCCFSRMVCSFPARVCFPRGPSERVIGTVLGTTLKCLADCVRYSCAIHSMSIRHVHSLEIPRRVGLLAACPGDVCSKMDSVNGSSVRP